MRDIRYKKRPKIYPPIDIHLPTCPLPHTQYENVELFTWLRGKYTNPAYKMYQTVNNIYVYIYGRVSGSSLVRGAILTREDPLTRAKTFFQENMTPLPMYALYYVYIVNYAGAEEHDLKRPVVF